jgi:hypothetical protein
MAAPGRTDMDNSVTRTRPPAKEAVGRTLTLEKASPVATPVLGIAERAQ